MNRIPRNRQLIQKSERQIEKLMLKELTVIRKKVTEHVGSSVTKSKEPKLPKELFALSRNSMGRIFKVFEKVFIDGEQRASKQIEGTIPTDYTIKQFRENARRYAARHGAQLVKELQDSTRTMVRQTVAAGIKNGLSVGEVAQNLRSGYAFSEARAKTIAVTETARADIEGNLKLYKDAGVEKKRWVVGSEQCELCEANAADGVIDMDDTFSSGDSAPPAHPNCRCDLLPVFDED